MFHQYKLGWIFQLVVGINMIAFNYVGSSEISSYIRKCCINGLQISRLARPCRSFELADSEIPHLWLGLCYSTASVCCSRENDKQICDMGRLSALKGSSCTEMSNSTVHADCCRACQVGLAVKASGKKCNDPLFSYFTEIESYMICCGNELDINQKPYENSLEQKSEHKEEDGSDGTIVLHDDDDICSKVPNLCAHICINTFSAYECKCHPGYSLDDNNVTCTAKNESVNAQIDQQDDMSEQSPDSIEADNMESRAKANNSRAINDCPSGYKFVKIKQKCIDIDECIVGLHECKDRQYCHNTVGSYRCLTATTRPCEIGYRYNTDSEKCEDYNECDDFPCEPNYKCFNNLGGYDCKKLPIINSTVASVDKCEQGFYLKDNKDCIDVNECLHENACDINQMCVNEIGGYHCDCKNGFNLDISSSSCVDINECSINNHNCLPTQRCDNTIGSYICTRLQSCGTGYTLNAESGNCDDDDECTLKTHNCPADYDCYNTKGSFRCYRRPSPTTTSSKARTVTPATSTTSRWVSYSGNTSYTSSQTYNPSSYIQAGYMSTLPCTRGFHRNYLGACVDVNECVVSNPCASHQRCINTNGSYRCDNLLTCIAGFKSSDGISCIDINECETGDHNCAENQICQNRNGGFICVCQPGHQLTQLGNGVSRCVDIDECSSIKGSPPVCSSNAYCINTIGSYYCECKSGFQKKIKDDDLRVVAHAQCYDVDECQEITGLCEQKCVNFWGGYRCTCNSGYELNIDNRTCNDVDECEVHKSYNLCMGHCNNVPGSYECSCPRGYTLAADKTSCRDIDECETTEACTGRYDICTNTRGGFKCATISCPYGYMNDVDQKNRCRQISNYCEGDDCFNKPSSYTYNFITFVSKLLMPPEGRTIFTLRGPLWYDDIDFDLKILRIQAPPNIEKASESHFDTFKGRNQVNLILKRSLEGPQDIELELAMTVFTSGMPRGKSVAKIFIYVSQYTF